MGICSSSQYTIKADNRLTWPPPSTTKIIYPDGNLQQLSQPIKASVVLSQNPSCFLRNSELTYVNSCLRQVPGDEQLQLYQIYFLMPLSMSQAPLSLEELCSLAIKAGAALSRLNEAYSHKEVCISGLLQLQLIKNVVKHHPIGIIKI